MKKEYYRVKLNKHNFANPNQIINGYLGNTFGDGKIAEYTRGEAIKKANTFLGKIEKTDTSNYTWLLDELTSVEDKIYKALENEIDNSKYKSKYISDCNALRVNVFDYEELVCWDEKLVFLDKNGHHYSLLCDATLYDLIDILNSI